MRALATSIPALALLALAGCASPIVGAECAEGFTACDGRCVRLADDPESCGACGHACVSGMCVDGTCPEDPQLDGGLADGEVDPLRDGGPDATRPDFGPPPECACNVGERCCDGMCVGTDFEPADCGECGNTCGSGDVCSSGVCLPACEAGLTLCAGRCLDLSSDPNNCGSCGNVCTSGICIDGMCAIGFPGHVILIGHDYRMNREGQNRVAGNAVFTAFASTPRVAAYEGDASRSLVMGVDRAIDQVATARARSWTKSVVDAADVPFALADADVFLIYPQGDGTDDAELRATAELWSVALDTFTQRGGVVVAFDGDGTHGGTWQMLAAARLLDAAGRVDVTGQELRLSGPSDSVAFGVPLRYIGEQDTVRFLAADGAEAVVAHPDGPVVLHRTIVPPP